jgi:hypothetical protein
MSNYNYEAEISLKLPTVPICTRGISRKHINKHKAFVANDVASLSLTEGPFVWKPRQERKVRWRGVLAACGSSAGSRFLGFGSVVLV